MAPWSQGSDPIIERSTFATNHASTSTWGGGLHVQGTTNDVLKVWNSTLSGNVAGSGGAISLLGAMSDPLEVELRHVTVYGNSGTSGSAARVSNAAELRYQASIVAGTCVGTGTIGSDGYNVVGFASSGQCDDSGTGDWTSSMISLDALGKGTGEWTRYHEISTGREPYRIVDTSVCLPDDQREHARPTNADCLAGSWQD